MVSSGVSLAGGTATGVVLMGLSSRTGGVLAGAGVSGFCVCGAGL